MADVFTDTVNLLELTLIGVIAYLAYEAYTKTHSVVNETNIACGTAAAYAKLPFGAGALLYSDDFVVPTSGATIGQLKAAGWSGQELADAVAAAACAEAAVAAQAEE